MVSISWAIWVGEQTARDYYNLFFGSFGRLGLGLKIRSGSVAVWVVSEGDSFGVVRPFGLAQTHPISCPPNPFKSSVELLLVLYKLYQNSYETLELCSLQLINPF